MTAQHTQPAYEKLVDFLIDQIEKHQQLPWENPWINKDFMMPMNIRGTSYRGSNVFVLSFIQAIREYKHCIWLTYKQAQELGGQVNHGEKGTPVIYWNMVTKKTSPQHSEDQDGDGDEKKIPFIRVYYVYNMEQCTLPQTIQDKFKLIERTFNPINKAEEILTGMKNKPIIKHSQIARAFYSPKDDTVEVPEGKYFKKPEYYYSTMFHELVHATGHWNRLNREGVSIKFNDRQTYSKEELIAEFGSVFLSNVSGIEKEPTEDHAAYLQNWVKYLKDHKKELIFAAQAAQKAVDYILKV